MLEVLPSIAYASRLARRFPRTFKGKAGLGADDLVVMSSEDYKSESINSEGYEDILGEHNGSQRMIVAAICQQGKDEAQSSAQLEICMNDGSGWTVSRLANAAYEFVSVDDHGLRSVARWVPKQSKSGQRTPTIGKEPPAWEEKKYSFSLLNPNSRRHAIIACLDRHSIEVSDWYVDPETVRKDSDSLTPTLLSSSEEPSVKDPIEVSHALRMFIMVSGICVAFEEGFSSRFRHNDIAPSSPNLSSKQHHRSFSLGINQPDSPQASSQARPSMENVHRARVSLQQTRSTSAVPQSPKLGESKFMPRRTLSSNGSFMGRLKGRNSISSRSRQLDDIHDSEIEVLPTKIERHDIPFRPTQTRITSYPETAGEPRWDRSSDRGKAETMGAPAQPHTGKSRTRKLSRIFGLSRSSSGIA